MLEQVLKSEGKDVTVFGHGQVLFRKNRSTSRLSAGSRRQVPCPQVSRLWNCPTQGQGRLAWATVEVGLGTGSPACSDRSFALKDATQIALAMQNSDDLDRVLVEKIVEANCFETRDRPGTQTL
jgi:hypothetical protein